MKLAALSSELGSYNMYAKNEPAGPTLELDHPLHL